MEFASNKFRVLRELLFQADKLRLKPPKKGQQPKKVRRVGGQQHQQGTGQQLIRVEADEAGGDGNGGQRVGVSGGEEGRAGHHKVDHKTGEELIF